MSIIATQLRKSAGHHNAYCTNKQKVLHNGKPLDLPKGRSAKQCPCGQWFSLPTCHAPRHKSCTASCAASQRAAKARERLQLCQECGGEFVPRPNQLRNGGGKYCSVQCSLAAVRRSPEFLASMPKAVETRRRNHVPRPPEENPRWKGGPEAYRRRRQESGAGAAQLRAYRKKNPERTREWAQNRKYRKHGRLAYGTIPKLMALQRGKCAHCNCNIVGGYHVDHIVPLAKGGRHEAENVQILCGPCNLRKSDRDPIAFAQLSGRLL